MYIFSVVCSFPKLAISNNSHNDEMSTFLYQNMFTSLLKARRMIETVAKEDGDGCVLFKRSIPKNVWNRLKQGETIHNFPLAIYECVNPKPERLETIGATKRFYSITVYKLK